MKDGAGTVVATEEVVFPWHQPGAEEKQKTFEFWVNSWRYKETYRNNVIIAYDNAESDESKLRIVKFQRQMSELSKTSRDEWDKVLARKQGIFS